MSACRLCGCRLTGRPLATLRRAPAAAQALPERKALRADTAITLRIRECPGCGLVQHTASPVPYYREALTAAGLSPEMTGYRARQLGEWVERFGLRGRRVVEIGCGRGELLPLLHDLGVSPTGLEWGAAAALDSPSPALRIEHGYPTLRRRMANAPFAAFVCINFLEHAPRPSAFLRGILASLDDDAVGLVEVPSLEHMVESRKGYDWVADHVCYYSAETLRLALELNGFVVEEMRREWKGYDLAASVRRRPRSTVSMLQADLRRTATRLRRWLAVQARSGRKVAVWGASHQALTLLAEAESCGAVDRIIDSAPFKQGRFSPVTHIPIEAPSSLEDAPVDVVLVMAAGYSQEVIDTLESESRFEGEVFVLRDNEILPVSARREISERRVAS